MFDSLIAIHLANQHTICFSAIAKLCEFSYRNNTLITLMVDAHFNICHCQYHSFAATLAKSYSRSPFADLLRLACFRMGFLIPTARIVLKKNQ